MARSRDKTGAALLVAVVVLLAGSFAGFSFGATGRELHSASQATPLLLQSAAATAREAVPCERQPGRRDLPRPVLSVEPTPHERPAPRIRPISI